MSDYLVLVTDGTKARFFSLEPAAVLQLDTSPKLVEQQDLISTEIDVPGKDMWADQKSGRNRAPFQGPAHGYDDHRDKHIEEFQRRFAHRISEAAIKLAQRHHAKQLVMVAETQMLGLLRKELAIPPHASFCVQEFAKDLTKLGTEELHSHLVQADLLPAIRKPH